MAANSMSGAGFLATPASPPITTPNAGRQAEMVENRLDEALRLVGDEAEQDTFAMQGFERLARAGHAASSSR